MTQHDSLSSSYKELDRYWVRVVILSRWRTWPPAPTKDTLQVPGPGPPRGLANPGSRRQLLGLRSNLPSSLFYPHCSPNPLRLWRRGTRGGGAEVRNYWATPCTPGVPPNPRRICGPRRPSQTSLPREFRDSTIRRAQVLSYPQTQTKRDPQGQARPPPPSLALLRGSVPSTRLTRSTTSLCRSRAFCFPLGVSEALDGARGCSSRSSRRPSSRRGEAAGPWGRMARGGPGTHGAGEERPGSPDDVITVWPRRAPRPPPLVA